MIRELCPCGCGYDIEDRRGQLLDIRHSELAFQGLPPLPDFVTGVGHTSYLGRYSSFARAESPSDATGYTPPDR